MPRVRVGDVELFCEVHGSGPPLLLIEGAYYATWMWFKQVPYLTRFFQVITFDNRGAGFSDQPPPPYTTAQMADDAAGLLEVLGVERAHVLGVSMGGMIAQELALRHPGKVEGLVLACTTPLPIPREEFDRILREVQPLPTLEAKYRRGFELAAAPGYFDQNPWDLDEMLQARLANPQSLQGFQGHASAIMTHDTGARLGQIDTPTLVLHGDADTVVPPTGADLLAQGIPGAARALFPGAGHLFFVERAVQFNRTLSEFLLTL
jgi:3-oxoadipate enol-lactonase